jgi:hypothetical protein
MHDIGGWYVETFGRNERGRTVLSPRHWDSFADTTEMYDLSHYFVSTYSSAIVSSSIIHVASLYILPYDFQFIIRPLVFVLYEQQLLPIFVYHLYI